MAKDNIWQWDETAANNTDVASIDITGVTGKVKDGDNAMRAIMSQVITAEGKGTAIASAATLTLSGPERYFHLTGSTGPITDIDFTDAVNGRWAWLIFDSTPTITHNSTTLKLPGGASIVAAVGDRGLFIQDASDNVICLAYVRASGVPVSNGWETIAQETVTSVASWTKTDLSAFHTLRLTGYVRPATDATGIVLRTSSDNGSNYDSGASDYSWQRIDGIDATASAFRSSGATSFTFTGGLGNANDEGADFEIVLTRFNVARQCLMRANVHEVTEAPADEFRVIGGRRLSSSARDAVQLIASSGNVASLTILVEGIRG
jgi:hypothetical protein